MTNATTPANDVTPDANLVAYEALEQKAREFYGRFSLEYAEARQRTENYLDRRASARSRGW